MNKVGIWERENRVFDRVKRAAEGQSLSTRLLHGSHPADFREENLDLLCITASAQGWAGAPAIDCRMLLLPGGLGPLARGLRCACAVSYGTSTKDTLTFSSLEGDQICMALQRELVTLPGGVVEQQEWVLPFPPGSDAMDYLAAAGILLILGLPPELLT